MKILIATIWLIVWLTEPALASCSTNTVFLPDGSVRFCTTCCDSGGYCTTTCL